VAVDRQRAQRQSDRLDVGLIARPEDARGERPVSKQTVGRLSATTVCVAAAAAVFAQADTTRALLLGLGTGALVAAIALAVVLTYRGSGVVNFASAATAMYAAYVYDGLRRDGTLFLPPLPNPLALVEGIVHWAGADGFTVPHWPTEVSLGSSMKFWPALVVTLAVSALMGALFHLLVFRPLRHAPPLAKVVASVGLLLVLQAVVVLRFGGTPRPVQPILDKTPVDLPRDTTIPQDQLLLAGLVILLALALWALFRFTRFGLATRAAAENEKGAMTLGFSPDFLAGTNWVLSTLLAGLLGVLVATVNGSIDPITITLLIVPALGAALLGNFTSFGIAAAAGLGIAMTQSLIQYLTTKDWWPHSGTGALPGVKESLPLLVIVVALFLRGRTLPTRGAIGTGRLPFAPRPTGVPAKVGAAAVACFAALLFLGPDWRLGVNNTLIGVIICLSLVVLTGFVGQISLAQMAFAGIAGFTLSKLTTDFGVPFPFGPLIGATVAVLFGLVAAVPALRVRGVNLAVVTLAAAVAIENFVFKNPSCSGGDQGARVPPPRFLGLGFGPNDPGSLDDKLPNPWFGVFCLVVVVFLAVLVVNLRRSATGRRMLAVRANERAAAAAGVSVTGTKLLAFGIAAFIAGLGGALSGYRFGSVTPLFFGSIASLTFLAFAYLGGISSVSGAVIGGCLVAGGVGFTALDQWFGVGPEYTLLLGGLGLVITAVLNPEGISGALGQLSHRVARRHPSRRAAASPATTPGAAPAAPVGAKS
jgi:branched-chain amino acid transport system permease protein